MTRAALLAALMPLAGLISACGPTSLGGVDRFDGKMSECTVVPEEGFGPFPGDLGDGVIVFVDQAAGDVFFTWGHTDKSFATAYLFRGSKASAGHFASTTLDVNGETTFSLDLNVRDDDVDGTWVETSPTPDVGPTITCPFSASR